MSSSLLSTDGYKFSMAEAGFPLRKETFYYSHRKGGPQIVPCDIEKFIREILPHADKRTHPDPEFFGEAFEPDYEYLEKKQYEMGFAFRTAIQRFEDLEVRALPWGAVFYPGEPVFSVTGPSALVSWLEPLVLQLSYRIQVMTELLRFTNLDLIERELQAVTCDAQRDLLIRMIQDAKLSLVPAPADGSKYMKAVAKNAAALVAIVGDPARIFEVGLRSATCSDQHDLALVALKDLGILRTSNVEGARANGMVPVGTMGHEHVQRYGDDEAAFRAMRDRRPYRSSFLLDTYDTILSGLPTAFQLMEEDPKAVDSVRYDSGDKQAQYLYAVEQARHRGIHMRHVIEDGLDAEATASFERLRTAVSVLPEDQFYGYGGYLIAQPSGSTLTRDRVGATWKLSQSAGKPVMKFSNDSGKASLPGRPVVFRRASANGPMGIIGQEGEPCPDGYILLTGLPSSEARALFQGRPPVILDEGLPASIMSPETLSMRRALEAKRRELMARGGRT